jgi:hypothetical protein
MKKEALGYSWKRIGSRAVSGLVILELSALFGSYLLYRKTNHDPEFRYKLYRTKGLYPMLESYYKLGETLNSESNIRASDRDLWTEQGKQL